MVKLSICIPYYKTYEITNQLLKHLSIQQTSEVEIILIDDYCKNEFFNIKDELALNNIKLIEHKINKGVSKSRNDGIEMANGKYIAFIDSDDMVMPDYIEQLLNLINTRDEDIILFNWLDINTNDVVRHPSNPAVWKAIYKKDILPRFDENLRCREDYYFQKELESKNLTKYYYDRVLYIYNSGREDSLTWKNERGEL